MKIPSFIFFVIRITLGIIFVVSGFQKLWAPAANLAAVIEKYEIISGPMVMVLAQTLPWAEFIAGVFFVLGFRQKISLGVLWAMNTVFIGVLSSTIIRRVPVEECGCFGEALSLPLPVMLALDILFWLLFLLYFVSLNRAKTLSVDAYLEENG